MRKALVSLLFLFASSFLFSQTFSLTDANCKVGSYYRSFNVIFDLAKSTLRPECYPNLDSVFNFLTTNPTIKLEIQVHSDNRGTSLSNKDLTRSRAVSIMNYFISKGIDSKRLSAVGYGETKPIYSEKEISNCPKPDPNGRPAKTNRRVEYKILAI